LPFPTEKPRFPQGFPHLWKTCSKPLIFLLSDNGKTQEIPLSCKEREKGKTAFFLLWKTDRFFPVSTIFSSFPQGKRCGKPSQKQAKALFERKAAAFSRRVWEADRFSPFFPIAFPPGFPRKTNRQRAEDPLKNKENFTFPQFPQALLLLLLFYCIYRLSLSASRRTKEGRMKTAFSPRGGEESAKLCRIAAEA
jgi:hypothetical protein